MAWKGSYAGDSAPHPTLPRYSSRRTRNPREDRRKESLRHGCGHSHRRSPASWSRAVGRNRCEAQRGLHLRPRKCHPGLGPPPATHGPEGAGLAALAPRCTGRYAGFNRQVCASIHPTFSAFLNSGALCGRNLNPNAPRLPIQNQQVVNYIRT